MEDLKKSRTYALGNLTKKINKLTELSSSLDNEAIRNAIEQLMKHLQIYQQAHSNYHESLTDDHEIEISRNQYAVTIERVESAERHALTSLSSLEKTPSVTGISRASSSRYSTASAKTRAAAKKKALEAKAKALQEVQIIEFEELKLKQRKAQLELASDIEAIEAERKAYEDAEAEEHALERGHFTPWHLPTNVTQQPSITQADVTQADVTQFNVMPTSITQSTPITPGSVTHLLHVTPSAVTQSPSVQSTAVTQSPSVQSTTVTQSPSVQSTAVTQSPSVQSTAVMQSPSVQSTAVMQSPSVQSTAVTQSPSVQSTAVTQSPSVQSTAVTQSPSVQSTAVTHSPSVQSTAVTHSPSVQSTAVTQSPSVQSTAVTQLSSVQPSAVMQSPSAQSVAVTQSPSVQPTTVTQPPSVQPTAVTQSPSIQTTPVMHSTPILATAVTRSTFAIPTDETNFTPVMQPLVTSQPTASSHITQPEQPITPSTCAQTPLITNAPHRQVYWTPVENAYLGPTRLTSYPTHQSYQTPYSSMLMQEELVTRLMESEERQSCALQKIVNQQQQSVTSLTLPLPSLSTFSGDPAEYTNFIKSFELLIESRTPTPSARLLYLVQYTSGPVQELMRSCLTMKESEGYTKARQLLKERYGQSYRIATALVQKIAEGPPIKAEDSAALQQFATNLISCTNTLRDIGSLGKLDSQDNLQKIVNRLPYGLRLRWRDVVDSIIEREDRDATIDDVTKYIAAKARAASHPVFGKVDQSHKSTIPTSIPRRPAPRQPKPVVFSALASHAQQSPKPTDSSKLKLKCPLCDKNHWLSRCEQFRKRSVEDRIKFVLDKKLCNNCLSPGHFANNCTKDKFCKVEGCTTKHSSFLHLKPARAATTNAVHLEQAGQSASSSIDNQQSAQNGFVSLSTQSTVIPVTSLAMVPVRVRVPGQQQVVETYAFLDNGSNTSFITETLMNKLGSKGNSVDLSLTTLQSKNAAVKSVRNTLEISDLNDENVVILPAVFSVKSLPVSTADIATEEDLSRWKHLRDIKLDVLESTEVGLLIGSDIPEILQPLDVRTGVKGSPYATRTLLGWTVNGPLKRSNNTPMIKANLIQGDAQLNEQFERFCNHEFNDRDNGDVAMSRDDLKALQIMEDSASIVNSHYEVSMPWKCYPPHLSNNKVMAETRLRYLKRKLQANETLHVKYQAFIDDMVSKGQARRVPRSELNNTSVFYLPHHNVVNPQKPNKCRVVWDCAAKWRGTSLNDQLLRGPDLTNTLVGVLTRFREEPVAFMADIEGMFHQVRVKPTDRDYLRFLWWPEGNLECEPAEYQMLVHLFGATSSPSCANFALKKTATDNATKFDPQTIKTVHTNFYVDDCLKSVPSVSGGKQLALQLRTILSRGGFRLTKWTSNSKELLRSVPEIERASNVKNLDFENPLAERTLGVRWDVQKDQFGFKIKPKDKPSTRRGLLSMISSVYDPLGFVSPAILPAKFILQELCRKKLAWDDAIPVEDNRAWQEWIQDLHKLEEFTINRCLKPDEYGRVVRYELHHFSDASAKGYGAASYLRMVNESGRFHCALIMAKSRLAPLKTITIPRLELSAAVLATRLDRIIRAELTLPIDSSTFWTDSTCVLQYIANKNKRFQVFVANRIAKILDRSNEAQWRYIDTELNPADEASRGLSIDAFLADKRWIEGPAFLYKTPDSWPKQPNVGKLKDPEVKREVTNFATTATKTHPLLTAIERCSSWNRLRRVVAWILRYKRQLITAVEKRKKGQSIDQKMSVIPIEVTEIDNAELEIIKCVQTQVFESEILSLKARSTSTRPKEILKGSSIYKLDPILVDGLIRVGGRLHSAPIDDDAKHPIILPKGHPLVCLIVAHYHQCCGHSGQEHTLALIREKFWIVKARVTVRNVLSRCVDCKRRQAPAVRQKMASLPRDRVTPFHPPFTYTGVDLFGPYEIQRGRSMVKRYGVLFTCLTVRAIHIEVANSLDTDSFLNALRRFTARRGQPKEIRSDNGGNFVKGERELREAVQEWNQQQIHDSLTQRGIKWTFNPPAGSHHGGVWERCIRTVRKVLKALVCQQRMNDESLHTLMCEVEAIVNGRPITKVSDDPRDPEPLTPNHLLVLRAGPTVPPGTFVKRDGYGTRRWRQVQYMANIFWRRWVREYLPALQERHKWNKDQKNVAVNDVVLVLDNNTPRSTWPLARITEVHTNRRDGLVRSVRLKTKSTELVRPVTKVVLLESAAEEER